MDRVPPSDDPLLARALSAGEQAWRRGETTRAQWLLLLALDRAEARGDPLGTLGARQLLGHIAFEAGDLTLAAAHHRAVLAQSRALGLDLGRASALHNLGLVALAAGRPARAWRLLTAAATRYERIGHTAGVEVVCANMARLAGLWDGGVGGSEET